VLFFATSSREKVSEEVTPGMTESSEESLVWEAIAAEYFPQPEVKYLAPGGDGGVMITGRDTPHVVLIVPRPARHNCEQN
jgi:hypothetical protein